MHRGIPERGPWRRLGWDLVRMAVLAVVFSALFVIGDLLIYGHVNW